MASEFDALPTGAPNSVDILFTFTYNYHGPYGLTWKLEPAKPPESTWTIKPGGANKTVASPQAVTDKAPVWLEESPNLDNTTNKTDEPPKSPKGELPETAKSPNLQNSITANIPEAETIKSPESKKTTDSPLELTGTATNVCAGVDAGVSIYLTETSANKYIASGKYDSKILLGHFFNMPGRVLRSGNGSTSLQFDGNMEFDNAVSSFPEGTKAPYTMTICISDTLKEIQGVYRIGQFKCSGAPEFDQYGILRLNRKN